MLLKILGLVVLSYALLIGVRQMRQSILFDKPGRVNILFYGENPTLISLGFDNKVDYLANFDNATELVIPGGYGLYRIGAIGKLAEIEKSPRVLARAFAGATSSYVDYYFYPSDPVVYRTVQSTDEGLSALLPQLTIPQALLGRGVGTNAKLLDRLVLFSSLVHRGKKDFQIIRTNFTEASDTQLFDRAAFEKKYQGFFYERVFREERADVKILYNSYEAASTISRILEGEGIRVVELMPEDRGLPGPPKECTVQVAHGRAEATASFIQSSFGCVVVPDVPTDADVVVRLGSKLEKLWN